MVKCGVIGCQNRSHERYIQRVSYHSFPRDASQRKEWLRAIKREYWTPPYNAVICSDHFTANSLERNGTRMKLVPNAVPTLALVINSFSKGNNKRQKAEPVIDIYAPSTSGLTREYWLKREAEAKLAKETVKLDLPQGDKIDSNEKVLIKSEELHLGNKLNLIEKQEKQEPPPGHKLKLIEKQEEQELPPGRKLRLIEKQEEQDLPPGRKLKLIEKQEQELPSGRKLNVMEKQEQELPPGHDALAVCSTCFNIIQKKDAFCLMSNGSVLQKEFYRRITDGLQFDLFKADDLYQCKKCREFINVFYEFRIDSNKNNRLLNSIKWENKRKSLLFTVDESEIETALENMKNGVFDDADSNITYEKPTLKRIVRVFAKKSSSPPASPKNNPSAPHRTVRPTFPSTIPSASSSVTSSASFRPIPSASSRAPPPATSRANAAASFTATLPASSRTAPSTTSRATTSVSSSAILPASFSGARPKTISATALSSSNATLSASSSATFPVSSSAARPKSSRSTPASSSDVLPRSYSASKASYSATPSTFYSAATPASSSGIPPESFNASTASSSATTSSALQRHFSNFTVS